MLPLSFLSVASLRLTLFGRAKKHTRYISVLLLKTTVHACLSVGGLYMCVYLGSGRVFLWEYYFGHV